MFEQYEKKIYSQQGEDGIIEHIFNVIGTTNKVAAEIGMAVNFPECNTYNLGTLGWNTFWFDMQMIDVSKIPPNGVFVKNKVTADNVVGLFEKVSVPIEMDLLSIDIDSNDYYIREALDKYKPRVCIQEYNGCFDGAVEYIMPRHDDHVLIHNTIFGASLKSIEIQADRQGYDLVYCDERGVNAFFIRKDINPFGHVPSEKAWKKLFWC
jgi:hypothetical protein